ncbi:MAG: hypothetical protein DRI79_08630 [Chloroflexi bacterium]|nr:MAG: hypothetical protein DRI80_04815 [Chloroflexota bacterium]RLC87467.1 MAG: hypothetical protein DRI79_08630 [Chloroflexota bacterium]
MAEKMIAYCGLVCTECPAYLATQADDMEALERVAARWSEEFHAPITAAYCLCDGCLSDGGRLCGHCAECEVRACAIARGLVNCAHCDDYGCEKITGFFKFAPGAKATLEEIRKAL